MAGYHIIMLSHYRRIQANLQLAAAGLRRIHYIVSHRNLAPAMLTVLKKSIIAVLMWFAGCGLLSAQSFDYGFKHLTTDEGLSHDYVHSITRDKQGFLWIGTINGLNRFDGLKFRIFLNKVNDSTSLAHNFVTTTVCDNDGYLWIGTGNGVSRYDPHTESFRQLRLPDSVDNNVGHVARATDGGIYVFHNHRLYRVNTGKLTVTLLKTFGPDSEVSPVFTAPHGNIWVIVKSALYLVDPRTLSVDYIMGIDAAHPTGWPGVMCVYTDPTAQAWVGTWEGGLFRYDEAGKQCIRVTLKLPFIISISADPNFAENHLLWTSAGYSGLMQYNIKTGGLIDMPKYAQQPWSHNGGRIHTFYRDTTNSILWIGTEFGVEKYDPNTEHFARKMLPSAGAVGQFPSVNAVIQDKTDTSGHTWWISSWVGGMYKWDRSTDSMTNYSHKLHSAEIFDLEQDNDGNIWIGEWRGIQIFNPRTNEWKLVDSFIRNDTVSTKMLQLYKDRRGNMWIAPNYDGLFKYDWAKKKFIRFELGGALPEPKRVWTTGIAEDKNGVMWFAGGLHTFYITPDDKVNVFKIKADPNIKSSAAYGIAIDKSDNIWVTANDKLINFNRDGEILKVYTDQNGLQGTSPRWMLSDPQGYLWIGTEMALHSFNPATGHFRYYKKEDGLFSNNITEPMKIQPNGDLFIGFHNAFSYTNVYKLNHHETQVPFIFTGIQIEDRNISPINVHSVTLDPGENTLNVDFAALDYSKPEKMQYLYWMEGTDKQWHTTTQRTLSFANLAGGNYILHLKVMGPNGIISKEELSLNVKVIPPFYKTWWFWLLVALGAGALLYTYYQMRQAQKIRLEKIRERIATDLHDDMGSTLSSIRIFSDVARSQLDGSHPQVVPILEKISNNASQLSDNMQDIIWTIKQDHDKLEDLVTRIREFGLKLCDAKDIAFKVHISDSFKTSRLNLEQRRNLYLIFKESLNNAIKYSNCTTIQLFITQQRRHLKMVIEDNGKGFSEASITKGNGLKNIRKRAQEINGSATIESVDGRGTRIDIMVELN
jgi:signal transduction histidine kinase/ligand-binding sensor domain-containing protein